MEIQLYYQDNSLSGDSLVSQKKLSGGKYEVYLITLSSDNQCYVLKLFPNSPSGIVHYNKERLLINLDHPNVIKHVPVCCPNEDKSVVLTEHAQYGDFFDLVTSDIFDNNDPLMRTYFHQFIEGLEHIHSKGVAHLDIKLENLMLGADYKLKIIDFDQAQMIADKSMTSKGTQGYRPLEVLNGECKDLSAVDIYAAGIILYAFKAKEFPFLEKMDLKEKDIRCYTTYVKHKRSFWLIKNELKMRDSKENFFENSFIELVNGMVHEDPKKRMTIKEVKNSTWYKGHVLCNESLTVEMKKKLEDFVK